MTYAFCTFHIRRADKFTHIDRSERDDVRQKEPIETLKYALRYAKEARADLCARETIMISAAKMVEKLDVGNYVAWVRSLEFGGFQDRAKKAMR